MVWRKHYETRILRNLECPVVQIISLDGTPIKDQPEVWIGSFGFAALADQGVWWRLFQSDFPNDRRVKRVFVVEKADTKDIETAQSLVPPSETNRTYLALDLNQAWNNLIEPERPDTGFAAIIVHGKIPLVMVGPPTEEAWDTFHEEWRTKT